MENARFILKTGSGIFIFVLGKICTTKQICILINMAQTMLVIRLWGTLSRSWNPCALHGFPRK